ncbi:hypothetical protein [Ectobacillus polymachus]|uniref:hypothetical protein n=1 Tax=Ectobacillus polymachus TaxID=1508806 RepID=UPI003A84BE82
MEQKFSKEAFWTKVKHAAKKAGAFVIYSFPIDSKMNVLSKPACLLSKITIYHFSTYLAHTSSETIGLPQNSPFEISSFLL